MRFNDPSAGSPTETLLRLLLPCQLRVQRGSPGRRVANHPGGPSLHASPSVEPAGATGGVYKGQGRNRRELMTRAY